MNLTIKLSTGLSLPGERLAYFDKPSLARHFPVWHCFKIQLASESYLVRSLGSLIIGTGRTKVPVRPKLIESTELSNGRLQLLFFRSAIVAQMHFFRQFGRKEVAREIQCYGPPSALRLVFFLHFNRFEVKYGISRMVIR